MIEKLPKIKLYTQYLTNGFLVEYFKWNDDILQRLYQEIGMYKIDTYQNLAGELLLLYAHFAYGITQPSISQVPVIYDDDFLYDYGSIYDDAGNEIKIDDESMKAYIFWNIRKDIKSNNIQNLYKRIKDFVQLPYVDIVVEETFCNVFRIILPRKNRTIFFKQMINEKRIGIAGGVALEVQLNG